MDKVCKYFLMEIYILDIIKIIHLKIMANIIGLVGHIIEVNLCQEWGMVRENGICYMEIYIKENIWMIRKMEKEPIYGKMVPNI